MSESTQSGSSRTSGLLFTLAAAMLIQQGVAQTGVNVLSQHNDDARSGTQQLERILNPANVNVARFGLLAKLPVDDQVYGQPLVVSGVQIAGGTHDLVFVTTVNNSLYAFDANAPAAGPVWHVSFGTPANLYDADFGCLDINGSMGIIGTPVISLEHNALYVVALTGSSTGFSQRLHALDLATGADLAGSPSSITAPGFDPLLQNQRPGLALSGNTIYIGYASHCDKLPYHGFLLAYDATSLRQTAVLNTSPTGEGASIWHSGQAPAIDSAGNIYVVTGNGSWDGTRNFSETFLKLSPSLKILDWFTPTNHELLDANDIDLDSSGATLLPGNHVVGGGKEGVLYSLDEAHLGKLGDEHAADHFAATHSHLHSLVFWKSAKQGGLLYVWGQRDKARVFRVDANGNIAHEPAMTRSDANEGHPGAMLSLSSNGGTDGILWAAIHATGDSWHESRPGILHAYDADDISHELWNSYQNRPRDDCDNYSKMAPPTVANGRVFLASFGRQNIGTGQLCIYGLLPNGPVPSAPGAPQDRLDHARLFLTWPPVPATTSYTVFSAIEPGAPFSVVASGLTTPTLHNIPMKSKTALFRVSAINANGESKPSPTVTIGGEPSATERHMH